MQLQKNYGIKRYVVADFLAAILSWICFFVFRKNMIEKIHFSFYELYSDNKFILGVLLIPSCWILYYFIDNTYVGLLKKSRLQEIYVTAKQAIVGGIVLFFGLMLNDIISGYKDYYFLFFGFIFLHFTITLFFRISLLNYIKTQLSNGKIYIATLLIGNKENSNIIISELNSSKIKTPYKIVHAVEVETQNKITEQTIIANVQSYHFEEVMILLDKESTHLAERLIIYFLNQNKSVQILPSELDLLPVHFKTHRIFGSSLIEIPTEISTPWQKTSKRVVDILLSAFGLIILIPLFIFLAWKVKRSSKGTVFFLQNRVGLHGKEFSIIKFRSMIENAENGTPQLSVEDDARITPFGKTMRKYRLDELPQLWNVLIGEMSLVGPRPERKFFIDQIIQTAPQYLLLQRVKPGITSLGMVKYGYASTIKEMLQRMRFDLLYLENISVLMDIKILIYTVITLWQGKGK